MFKGFIFKEYTRRSYQLIAAGFYIPRDDNTEEKLRKKLIEFDLYTEPENVSIDYQLALYIKGECPENVLALGVSIFVPGALGPTGGIIGNPKRSIEHANGISEDIGNGFSTAAFPGGPGIVIYGNPEAAKDIIRHVLPGDGSIKTISKLVEEAMNSSLENAIIITDGTGSNCTGCAALIYGNMLEYMQLNRE